MWLIDLKTMHWDERAWKAIYRAFSPMPPMIRGKTMEKVVAQIEKHVREKKSEKVTLEDVFIVSKEILKSKNRYMFESLVESLRMEGNVDHEG